MRDSSEVHPWGPMVFRHIKAVHPRRWAVSRWELLGPRQGGGAEHTVPVAPHGTVPGNARILSPLPVGNVIVNVLVKETEMAEL